MLATMAETSEPKEKKKLTQLRVEPDLWERIKSAAKRRRMSANQYVLLATETQLQADEAKSQTA